MPTNDPAELLKRKHDELFEKCVDILDTRGHDAINEVVMDKLASYKFPMDYLLSLEGKLEAIRRGEITRLNDVISVDDMVHEYLKDKLDQVIANGITVHIDMINTIHDRSYSDYSALELNLKLDAAIHHINKKKKGGINYREH